MSLFKIMTEFYKLEISSQMICKLGANVMSLSFSLRTK